MLSPGVKPSGEMLKTSSEESHRQTVRKLTLFSAVPAQGLLQSFDSGFVAGPSDRNALLKMWEKASAAYNLGGNSFRSYSTADDVSVVDSANSARIESILKRAKQYAPYD